MVGLGYAPRDEQLYIPHITLGRVVVEEVPEDLASGLAFVVRRRTSWSTDSWNITDVALMESTRDANGEYHYQTHCIAPLRLT